MLVDIKQVESRHKWLLKELQLFVEEKKDLSSQLVTNKQLLQEAEHEVTN